MADDKSTLFLYIYLKMSYFNFYNIAVMSICIFQLMSTEFDVCKVSNRSMICIFPIKSVIA